VPHLDRTQLASADNLRYGAYVLAEADGGIPQLILIATGSEVAIALDARERMQNDGVPTRVVSMPSWTLFDRQPREYRDRVLPPAVRARVSIEAAGPVGWHQWVGYDGAIIAITRFGASAPAKHIFHQLGFTADNVVAHARVVLGRNGLDASLEEGVAAAGPARLGVDER
jgi:transketolase